jgi:exodeoxyribonuclease VII large subunit
MNREPMTVSYLNTYIKNIIEDDIQLNNVCIRGEISNFKYHSSGHMYFTLKDKNAKIKCVMFKTFGYFLKFMPEDGMDVIIQGNVSVYERDGQYQLYCNKMEPEGIGSLYLAFEQLKKKLQDEGFFEENRKKQIPLCPNRVGVVTSPTGAVIRDIINVASRRYSNVNIVLYPVKVQGEGSAESIVEGIKYFNQINDVDVIIIGRGGGSIEELWSFNEEIVARAIFKSNIPIISAVGHETDFTIADFVADIRASTPSHAAEISIPSYNDLKYRIESINSSLISVVRRRLINDKLSLKTITQLIEAKSPQNSIAQTMQYLDNLQSRIVHSIDNRLLRQRNRFEILIEKLDGISPLRILGRGYAFVEKNNAIVKDIEALRIGDEFKLNMQDGFANCKVIEITEGNLWQQEKKI